MPKYYPRIYIPSFNVLNTCHALLITTVINAGVHWLISLRTPLFKSYVFRLVREQSQIQALRCCLKEQASYVSTIPMCIFEDQSKILLLVILKLLWDFLQVSGNELWLYSACIFTLFYFLQIMHAFMKEQKQ